MTWEVKLLYDLFYPSVVSVGRSVGLIVIISRFTSLPMLLSELLFYVISVHDFTAYKLM